MLADPADNASEFISSAGADPADNASEFRSFAGADPADNASEFLSFAVSGVYLRGTKFLVKTDCLSLLHRDSIWTSSDPSMIRKFEKLANLDFTIEHVAGKANDAADFFSRYIHKDKLEYSETQTDIVQDDEEGE